jgi:hypothetical protein
MIVPSIRRRGIASQSVRQSQPVPFFDGSALTWLASTTSIVSTTSGGSANAAGAWTQLLAASATASTDTMSMLFLSTIAASASTSAENSTLIDIGIGASGSETAIISDVAIGGLQNVGLQLALPVRIAGNTRIAFRSRCATASRANQRSTAFHVFSSSFADRIPTSLDTLGTSQSTSAGTAMSGASGSWVQITAATTKDYQALILVPSGAGNFTGGTTSTNRLDLGIGAAGSEVAISSVVADVVGANGYIQPNYGLPGLVGVCGRAIPAGTRIAVRHDRASNPSWLAACVIGVPYV